MKSDDLGDQEGAGNAAFMLDMAEDVSRKGGPTFLSWNYSTSGNHTIIYARYGRTCKFTHLKNLIDLQVFFSYMRI